MSFQTLTGTYWNTVCRLEHHSPQNEVQEKMFCLFVWRKWFKNSRNKNIKAIFLLREESCQKYKFTTDKRHRFKAWSLLFSIFSLILPNLYNNSSIISTIVLSQLLPITLWEVKNKTFLISTIFLGQHCSKWFFLSRLHSSKNVLRNWTEKKYTWRNLMFFLIILSHDYMLEANMSIFLNISFSLVRIPIYL